MKSKLQTKQQGFTIIEVLIVLAIAGLILLIVFLAVPALQRNSRTTQKKNDVQRTLGIINEFVANNNGKLPSSGADQTKVVSDSNLSYYSTAAWAAGVQNALTTDTMTIVTGAKCGASGATAASSARSVAIQYMIETSGGLSAACQES